jgi:hypothetical protein
MRYTILASMTAAALAIVTAEANAQTNTVPDTSTKRYHLGLGKNEPAGRSRRRRKWQRVLAGA